MLDCEALTKAFNKTLFKNLDIHLGPGEILAVSVSYTHLTLPTKA